MKEVVIVDAVRTAIGAFQGSLGNVPASTLGATVIAGLLRRTGLDPQRVDEVILGQVLAAGVGQNPARQASIEAGLPETCPAMTINKVCGSGLKAVSLAAQAIKCGDADIIIAGGQENMTAAPHVLPQSREGKRMGNWNLQDSMIVDGLWDAFNDYHMGNTAENLVEKFELSREQQDEFAAASQQKTEKALNDNLFADEIEPVKIPVRRGDPVVFDRDEYPKSGVVLDDLARLRPAFIKDGSVTAGNSAGINDGAAAVLVMSAEAAGELGLKPLATIRAYSSAGVDPAIMGTGPIQATRKCLQRAGWEIGDLDLIEANEAFAAQTLTVSKELQWDDDKVNIHGGAIALGHPIGASGARILVTLLHGMQRENARKGLATLCIGGGQGVAMAVEKTA